MTGLNKNKEVLFEPNILDELVRRLPTMVDYLNAEDGEIEDGHQSEMVLQREIGKQLKTWLPSSNLVRQNKMLVRENDKMYIPDIIIDKIGGGCWAVFELKTLLRGDQLPVVDILEDLDKLCRYETENPEALCMFVLIASEKKLTNSRRVRSWEGLPISIDGDVFLETNVRVQNINETHVAIPWLFNDESAPLTYIWLVRHQSRKDTPRSSIYRFHGRMHEFAPQPIPLVGSC